MNKLMPLILSFSLAACATPRNAMQTPIPPPTRKAVPSRCSTYVVRSTDLATNETTLELRCRNLCGDGSTPCEERYFNPNGSRIETLRACYCDDEVIVGASECSPSIGGAGCRDLKTCRMALVYRYKPNGVPEDKPSGVRCVGECPTGTCQPLERASTTFDGVRIEILQCSCR